MFIRHRECVNCLRNRSENNMFKCTQLPGDVHQVSANLTSVPTTHSRLSTIEKE